MGFNPDSASFQVEFPYWGIGSYPSSEEGEEEEEPEGGEEEAKRDKDE